MKKLLKFFAVPAVLACGLLVSCNNGGMDLDLNPVVSTDTPSLAEPKNLGYGVLLTWGCTQDGSNFRVTRREGNGEEKTLDVVTENRYIDAVGFLNSLKEGVEYTYRVYNLGDKGNVDNSVNINNTGDNSYYYDYGRNEASGANYGINYIVKDSYAERKITFAAGSLKVKDAKLDADEKENVECSFKNGYLTIYFLNDENHIGYRKITITNEDTKRVVYSDEAWSNSYWRCNRSISADKITVEITNSWGDDYYADSDALKITGIENVVDPDSVDVQGLAATVRDGNVVLLWTTSNEDAVASDFTIQRGDSYNSADWETLEITATSGTKYDGTKYWTATDKSIEVGRSYVYKVIVDGNNYGSVSVTDVAGSITILSVSYDGTSAITLNWKAQNISEFTIYRAEGNLSGSLWGGLDENEYYDLYKLLSITPSKLYDTIENGKTMSVYTAKDTVEKNKDYTYIVTSKADDKFKVYSVNYAQTTKPSSTRISNLYLLDEDGNEVTYIGKDDKVTLQFSGNSDVTYKGVWTIGNYEVENKSQSFDFAKNDSDVYKHEFKASDFAVEQGKVNFYAQVYIGGELVSVESTTAYIYQ